MRRIGLWLTICLITCAVSVATDGPIQTFRGEVSDSQCAMNVHSLTRSHKEMLKSKSMGKTAGECSTYCIEHLGGRLVLAGRDVHYLDRPDLSQQYVGKRVRVRGTLDSGSNMIHVVEMQTE